MSRDGSHMAIVKRFAMADRTRTRWHIMSPLRYVSLFTSTKASAFSQHSLSRSKVERMMTSLSLSQYRGKGGIHYVKNRRWNWFLKPLGISNHAHTWCYNMSPKQPHLTWVGWGCTPEWDTHTHARTHARTHTHTHSDLFLRILTFSSLFMTHSELYLLCSLHAMQSFAVVIWIEVFS